jgi:hypothetical protein
MSIGDDTVFMCNNNGFNINQAQIANSSLINCTSDEDIADVRYNTSIESIDSRYETFYDSISPVRYKHGSETSKGYYLGFTAQQITDALTESELTTQDFAGMTLKN